MSFKLLLILGLVFLPVLLGQSTSTTTTAGDTDNNPNTTTTTTTTTNITNTTTPTPTNVTTTPAPTNVTTTPAPTNVTTTPAPTNVTATGPIYNTTAGARNISTANLRNVTIINIDLAQNYTAQWANISSAYGSQLNNFFSQINASTIVAALALPPGANIVLAALGALDYPSLANYNLDVANQLQAISNLTNISIANLAILNFVYDYATASTSVIAQDLANNIFHGFSFDSPLPDLIAPLVLHARYYSNGTFLFEGFSLAGYLGLIAGYKAGVYSASINRLFAPNTYWQQLATFSDDLVNFALRDLTASLALREGFITTTTFDDLIQYLSNTNTVTDTFYTIAGVLPGQGAVLTKPRNSLDNRASLTDQAGEWYLVQSNYLRNETDPAVDNRATAGVNILNTITQANITALNLGTELLDVFPIFNNDTVWNVVMQPNANFTNLTVWW